MSIPSDSTRASIVRKLRRYKSRLLWLTVVFVGLLSLGTLWLLGIVAGAALLAMCIGGAVGGIELAARYRYAPMRAVLTASGLAYMLINVGASWCAYYLLEEYGDILPATAKPSTYVLLAGIGALVFLRSSIFKVRIGDTDIGIGPAALLDTILLVADRGVDRREAVARAADISELVTGIQDRNRAALILTKYCISLMQNVDDATTKALIDDVRKIMIDQDVPQAIRLDIVALRLGTIVGPDVLEAAIAALGDRLRNNHLDGLPHEGSEKVTAAQSSKPSQSRSPDLVPVEVSREELVAEIAKKVGGG